MNWIFNVEIKNCILTEFVNLLNFQVVMGWFHSIDWYRDIYDIGNV